MIAVSSPDSCEAEIRGREQRLQVLPPGPRRQDDTARSRISCSVRLEALGRSPAVRTASEWPKTAVTSPLRKLLQRLLHRLDRLT